jgi:serine/threonine protein phosphatase PrpC
MSWILDSANHPNEKNEDRLFTWVSPRHIIYVLAVFDGHGGYGTIAANTAMSMCRVFFTHHGSVCEPWATVIWKHHLNTLFKAIHDAIRLAFKEGIPNTYIDTHGIVRDTESHDAIHGGTTATITLVNKTKQYCITANVGDSDAILIEPHQYELLSADHKPTNQKEWQRIKDLKLSRNPVMVYDSRPNYLPIFDTDGHRIQNYTNHPRLFGITPANVRGEPGVYVLFKGQDEAKHPLSTKLAMTRSLGDFTAHSVGVTCIPTVTEKPLPAGKFSIVVATDGLWDCWQYAEFEQYVNRGTPTEDILATTYQKAAVVFGKDIDDISVCILRVQPEPVNMTHTPYVDELGPFEMGQDLGKRCKRRGRSRRKKRT